MRSLLIEFHRFDDLEFGVLQGRYLVAAATCPVREYKWPIQHVEFHDLLSNLRYQAKADERKTALKEISAIASDMLGTADLEDLRRGDFPLQFDLVVNAAELAAVPFELATDDDGQPLFVRDEKLVELTRRVRFDFAETSIRWPAKPRILFAWAYPPGAGDEVPSEEHEKALRKALEPWMPLQAGAGEGDVLTILPQTSLGSLGKACRDAVEMKRPFTHIHLLAHGYPVGHGNRRRFGLALHDAEGDLDAVEPEKIKDALAPLCGETVVITLAACDSANRDNPLTPEKSIAHELHVLGFPVVVASQLPLTVSGSSLMVERFYGALLSGKDVRLALHEARIALYESRDRTGHDWASVVGYVRLPEGYAEHLLDVRLESVLAALKTAQGSSDKLVKSDETDPAQFDSVVELLRGRIAELKVFLRDTEKTERKGVLEENLGLLGSAEKRFAELFFERGRRGDADHWQQSMREALERSHDWYRQGYEHNFSHHWTGVQYLSLEAVLNGTINDRGHWYAAVAAAENDRKKPEEYWAHGSLAELYLLAPLAGQALRREAAAEILEEMKGRVRDHGGGDPFPIESTERQLRRYAEWWTTANGFFPGTSDLTAKAGRLLEVLRR